MPRCPKLTLRGKGVLGTDHLGYVGGGGGGGWATSSEHYLQEQQRYLQEFFPPK